MKKFVIKVEGMMCPMCEAHVNDAIRNVAQVKSVESSHKKGESVVISELDDVAAIKAAIEHTGYKVLDISVEEYKKEK